MEIKECRHIWRPIPTGQKCDSCGQQRAEQPPKGPYIQPGVENPPPLPPEALAGSPLGNSQSSKG